MKIELVPLCDPAAEPEPKLDSPLGLCSIQGRGTRKCSKHNDQNPPSAYIPLGKDSSDNMDNIE